MCKGPDEKGGPYRCSADMGKEWSTAQARYAEAAQRVSETSERKVAADAALARVEAGIEGASELDEGLERKHRLEVLEAARVRFVQESNEADQRHRQAQDGLRSASTAASKAQADYDATPRGVADLQSALDATERPDPGLVRRRDEALERMSSESTQRDARWGSESGAPVAIQRNTDHQGERWKNEYAALAVRDDLSASCVEHGYVLDAGSGREGTDYTVTFYRPGEGGRSKSMRVRYLAPAGSPSPAQADVLAVMSIKSSDYEGHRNFPAYCREQSVPRDERDAARADWQDGKRYSQQLRGFLGERSESYLKMARGHRAGVRTP